MRRLREAGLLIIVAALAACGQVAEYSEISYEFYTNEASYDQYTHAYALEAPSASASQTPIPYSIVPLEFFSLEEFLYAYRIVREGNAVGNFARMATDLDFLSVVELPLLVNFPETHQLDYITVFREAVWVHYAPKEALVSEEARWNSAANQENFTLWISRWDSESPMSDVMQQDNIANEDLIDGRHFSDITGSIYWAHGRELLILLLPNQLYATSPYDLPLTQTTTIDLRDEALVDYLIGELFQLTFNLGFASSDFPTISIPANANIHSFITTNHENIPIDNPTRRGHDFLGWYLDAGFTIPLSRILSPMPANDATLYAKWEY